MMNNRDRSCYIAHGMSFVNSRNKKSKLRDLAFFRYQSPNGLSILEF